MFRFQLVKFMDLLGAWQHFSVPTSELEEHLFEEGLGFDGSSIRGWQAINASDMLVIPDPATTVIDPFMKDVTVSMICNIVDPITREKYSRDPRNIAQKAEAYLKSTGIGDTAYFGPEAEFSFLTMFNTIPARMNRFIRSILLKQNGTPAGMKTLTWVTSRDIKKVISRLLLPIRFRIFALR